MMLEPENGTKILPMERIGAGVGRAKSKGRMRIAALILANASRA
jgi:hypothetical protein